MTVHSRALFEQLEPRILMSATPLPDNDDSAAVSVDLEEAQITEAEQVVHEILFVDSNVENYEALLVDLQRNVEIVIIDNDENGVQKITETLDGRADISAIHILSHGSAGEVSLGNMNLTSKNLVTFQSQLQAWGESLTEDADILIYGCNVGQNSGFVQDFAEYTGADVAASDDLTGDAVLGGDAILEVEHGAIEAAEVLQQAAFNKAELTLASDISIVNHSFEVDVVADGDFTNLAPTGWSRVVDGGGGVVDRNSGAFSTVVGITPDTDNEQLVFSNGDDFFQVLGTTLEANTSYTLTVDVGDRTDTGFSVSELRLGTGSTFGTNLLLGTVVNNTSPESGWETWVTTFTTGVGVVGDALRVELLSTSPQTLFDNVRLISNAVPVIVSADSGTVTEDADSPTLSVSGFVAFTDIDADDTHTVTAVADGSNSLGGVLTASVEKQEIIFSNNGQFSEGASGFRHVPVAGTVNMAFTEGVTPVTVAAVFEPLDNTASVIVDDTDFDQAFNMGFVASYTLENNYDVGTSDKLIVTISGERDRNDANSAFTGVTYNGIPLIEAVQFKNDPNSPAAIFYLDNPGVGTGDGTNNIVVSTNGKFNSYHGSWMAVSNTADGVGVTSNNADFFTTVTTTVDNSLVVAHNQVNGGAVPAVVESYVFWTYEVDNAATQSLAQGEAATETFTVTIIDNNGADVEQDIEVVVIGVNDVPTGSDQTLTASEPAGVSSGITNNLLVGSADVDGIAPKVGTVTGKNGAVTIISDADALDTSETIIVVLTDVASTDTYEVSVEVSSTGTYTVSELDQLSAGITASGSFSFTLVDDAGASSISHTASLTITGTNDVVIIGDDVLADQPVDDNSQITPFSTLTLSDEDINDNHDVSIIIEDGVTNGDFSFVVFEDSFETPDITGSVSVNPTGWVEKGHPNGLGIIDVDTGLFTTPHGSQALTTWQGSSEGATTTAAHLNIPVTSGEKYDLSFNVSHKSSVSFGDFKAELINIDSAGVVTILNSLSGIANLTDMSESFTLSYTAGSDLDGRLAIRFYDDKIGHYTNTPIFDNVELQVTDSSGGWTRLVDGDDGFTGEASDIQYTRTFNGASSIADAQTAIQSLVFKPVENKVQLALTEKTNFIVSVNDNSLLVVNDADISVVSTLVNDAPVIAGGPSTVNLNQANTPLSASGSFTVGDADTTDIVTASHTVAVTGFDQLTNAAYADMLVLTPTSVLDDTETSASLGWVFNSGSETFEYLAAGETLVLVYTVTVADDAATSASDAETITITITGTNAVTGFVDDGLSGQPVGDNSQVAPFSTVTFSDDDVNNSHQVSIVIKDGVTNGDFNNANSIGVDDFIVFEDSFETPDIIGSVSVNPTGWIEKGHPNGLGIIDVDTGLFTTPYGSQALTTWRGSSEGATTTAAHLAIPVTAGEQYDLSFNVAHKSSASFGDFKAQLINIDSIGVVTVLNSLSGVANSTDMSESFTLSYTAASTLGGRLAIRFYDDYVGNYRNTPVIDNVKLRVTDTPGSWVRLVAGDEGFTGGANDIQYKGIFNGASSTADAQAAVQSLVFKPIDNKLQVGLTEKTVFTVSVDDNSLLVANDSEISVISTSINDVPTGEDQTLTVTESAGANSEVSSATSNNLLRGSADVDVSSSVKVGTVTGDGATLTVTADADDADSSATITVELTDVALNTYDVSVKVNSDGSYTISNLDQIPATVVATGGFDFTLVDNFGAESATLTVSISIIGTNDAPVITGGPDIVDLDESDVLLSTFGSLTVGDVEKTDVVTASHTVGVTGVAPLTNTAYSNMLVLTPTSILDGTETSASLGWVFNSGSETFDYLAAGETLVLVYTVTATDDAGAAAASDTETITITITGSNDAPDISVETGDLAVGSLSEDSTAPITATLTVGDVDLTDVVTASVSSTVVLGGSAIGNTGNPNQTALFNMFGISPSAILSGSQTSASLSWTFTPVAGSFDHLSFGETLTLTYTIVATDDTAPTAGSDDQTVVITIVGSNDAPVISVETGDLAVGSLSEDSTTPITEKLTVGDVDLTDVVTASVSSTVVLGGNASANASNPSESDLFNMFGISPSAILSGSQTSASLSWTFTPVAGAFDHLSFGETLTLTYTIVATDDTAPTAGSDDQTVIITIVGSNDAPVISVEAGDLATGSLSEDSPTPITATLTVGDVDLTDVVTASVSSTVGLSGSASANVSNPSQIDLFNMFGMTPSAILNGSQTSESLSWTFTPVAGAFDHLAGGETLILTYTISATDDGSPAGSDSQTVVITINGIGDGVDVSVEAGDSDAETVLESDIGLFTSGTLTVTDIDVTDTASAVVTSVVQSGASSQIASSGLLAMFTVPNTDILDNTVTTGVLPWNFDSGSESFEYLNDGETLVLTYTVTVTDSKGDIDTQTVSISVVGENDFVFPSVGETPSTPVVETSSVIMSPPAAQVIIRGNSLSFFSQGSDLQFDTETLDEDALLIVGYIFNDNFLVEEEVADSGSIAGDGVEDLQVYDISQLSPEEQQMIYQLLFGEEEKEDAETEKDEGAFLVEEEALMEMASVQTEVDFSQSDLDTRVNLEDTLIGDFDCLNS
jgi:VCBS repeat-containing protein